MKESMDRAPVVAGVDGSRPSFAAAHWAAAEAVRRGAPLRLLHLWPWLPHLFPGAPSPSVLQIDTRRVLARLQADIRAEHPGLPVDSAVLTVDSPDSLAAAGEDAALLVLGSRGLGGFKGVLLGSTGLATAARASCPVVLVRTEPPALEEAPPAAVGGAPAWQPRPVVLGLDAHHPDDTLVEFALRAADQRGTRLRIVHVWGPPPLWSAYPVRLGEEERAEWEDNEMQLLRDVVHGWREKYPDLDVLLDVRLGSAAETLVHEAENACLVVVGRHLHRPPLGLRLGPVTHAVMQYARCPVAVVAHP